MTRMRAVRYLAETLFLAVGLAALVYLLAESGGVL